MLVTTPTLIDLLDELSAPDHKLRKNALTQLCSRFPAQAHQPLYNALYDENISIRAYAAKELGELRDKNAVSLLVNALTDTSQRVQLQALRALGKSKDTTVVGAITDHLCAFSPTVQLTAIKVLGKLGNPAAVPTLLVLITQVDEATQTVIVQALGSLKDRQAIPALLMLSRQPLAEETQHRLIEALGSFDDEAAIERLLEYARATTTSSFLAEEAIWALAQIGGNRILSELLTLYRETQDDEMRAWIIRSIGSIKHVKGEPKAQATELFLQLLNNTDKHLVTSAAIALGKAFKDERAISPLLNLLTSKDYHQLYESRRSLANLNGPRLLTELLTLYRSTSDNNLRVQLLQVLAQVKKIRCAEHEEAFQFLLQLLHEQQHPDLQLHASVALGGPFKDQRAVEPLLMLLRSKDEMVIRVALGALGNIGDPRAIGPLLHRLTEPAYANSAIKALGHFKEKRVVERLIAILDPRQVTTYKYHQFEVISALRQIGDPLAIEPLKAFEQCDIAYFRDLARKAVIDLEK